MFHAHRLIKSIPKHKLDYTRHMLLVTVADSVPRYPAECDARFEIADGIKMLTARFGVSLEDSLHCLAALKELYANAKRSQRK